MNNRFIYGIISIVLAAVIAFIAVPAVTSKTNSTCEIVRVKSYIARGRQITADDIETVTVGEYNLPATVAKKKEDVIGTYAAAEFYPGDYVLAGKVSAIPVSSDLTLNEIPDGKLAISITAKTLAAALSDKLQAGDIIRFYHYNEENEEQPVVDIEELKFVKVLSITDADGLDVDYTTPLEEDEEKQQTATLTVLVSPEQAVLLTRYENEGILHVALISRGNEKLAQELLERQEQILNKKYGTESAGGMDEAQGVPEPVPTDAPDGAENTGADASQNEEQEEIEMFQDEEE